MVAVAELKDTVLIPAGQIKFGRAGKDLWQTITGLSPGKTLVYFALERPWQRGKPIATREFSVIVR